MQADRLCPPPVRPHGASPRPATRWIALALTCVLGTGPAWGQTGSSKPVTGTESKATLLSISEQNGNPPDERPLPLMAHARFEDDGSIIDEIRIGGETRRVTVQPKANMPAYEIRPTNGARRAHTVDANGSPRVWNLLNF